MRGVNPRSLILLSVKVVLLLKIYLQALLHRHQPALNVRRYSQGKVVLLLPEPMLD